MITTEVQFSENNSDLTAFDMHFWPKMCMADCPS